MTNKLGKTQQAVYEYICNYINTNAYPPTVREIGSALSLKSTSTVHMHIKKLEEKGLLKLNPNKQRSISLVKDKMESFVPATNVPLVGEVAAGVPILANENVQEYFPLATSFVRGASNQEVFMLTVSGDSMIEAGIFNGDVIVVHNGIATNNGDIAVARVHGESATVKRIYKEGKQIRLHPDNASMEPIIVHARDVEIVGKVIGLLRRF